jgi:hypothetical protein
LDPEQVLFTPEKAPAVAHGTAAICATAPGRFYCALAGSRVRNTLIHRLAISNAVLTNYRL